MTLTPLSTSYQKFRKLPLTLGIFLICPSFGVSFGLNFGGGSQLSAQVPELILKTRSIHFGERGHNERPVETIEIKNTGSAPLKILEYKVSCSCIKVSPDRPTTIPQKGSLKLNISMGSGRAMGLLSKTLTIISNDLARPKITLPVSMKVHDGFKMSTLQLKYEGKQGKPPVSQYVDVFTRKIDQLTGKRVANPKMTLEVINIVGKFKRPGGKYFKTRIEKILGGRRIHIELDPKHPEGRVSAQLEAKLNGKRLILPIIGEMFKDILVTPRFVNFSQSSKKNLKSRTREVILTSLDNQAFSVLKTEIKPSKRSQKKGPLPEIEVKVHSSPDGQTHRLVVTVEPGVGAPERQSFYGKIHVFTNHQQKPEIVLSYTGFFKP